MSDSTSDVAVEAQPPQRMPRWVRDAILWWWGVLVVLWLALGITRELRGLLTQLALALFLSLAMEPLVDRLGRRGVKRGVATALAMLVLAVLCIAFVVAMGSLVANQLRQLAEDLPGYVTSAEEWAENRFNVEIESADVIDQLGTGSQTSEYLSSVADNLVGVGAGVLSAIFQLLTISLFAFYFTADGPRLRRAICSVLPPARQHEVLRVWELAINKSGAFLAARFILAVISAGVHWVAFAVLGLPSAVALALWVGIVSQFIPVIGIYIAGVLPTLIALGIEPTKALWVLLVIVVYQQIENYGLQPRVTAQTLNMHPAVAFAAVLAGSAMFGASGALLALPFLATVQSFISAYVARHNVVESRLTPAQDEESSVDGPSVDSPAVDDPAEDQQPTEGC